MGSSSQNSHISINLKKTFSSFWHFLSDQASEVGRLLRVGGEDHVALQPRQDLASGSGPISCRWQHWSRMMASCSFHSLEITVQIRIWDRCCHLTLCLHLIELNLIFFKFSFEIAKTPSGYGLMEIATTCYAAVPGSMPTTIKCFLISSKRWE